MELNIKNIINDYTINNLGIYCICKKYHIGKIKLKKILNDNNISLRKKGKQPLNKHYVIDDWKINKYKDIPNHHYIAKYKNDGKIFNDYMNEGGFLTSYIRDKENVDIPSLYERREYYKLTGNYWWEQYFDIILVENTQTKKCPYCDWETIDIENKSGAFENHLKNYHNISVTEYIEKFPNEINYFKKELNKAHLIKCKECGKYFSIIDGRHLQSHGMTKFDYVMKYGDTNLITSNLKNKLSECAYKMNINPNWEHNSSSYEKNIINLINESGIDLIHDDRNILDGKELDIYIPNKSIAIEVNGNMFHSERFGKKDKNYHLEKTNRCNEKGINLLQIFEDEIVFHKNIVYNKILHIIGADNNKLRIGGRKCRIKEIDNESASIFLNEFHIQGFASSTVYLGAFYNDVLIGVMTFKKEEEKGKWDLNRFASDYNYICQGVGGKLFKYFIKKYNPLEVKSFADRRWTINKDNNLYTNLGFILTDVLKPDYKYYNPKIDKFRRFHKFNFRKQILSKKYNLDINLTEDEMTKELGYDRIWDCGLFKYVWKAD